LSPQGTATKNFSMGEQYHIAGLPDPTLEHKAVNHRTLNRKVLNEIRVNPLKTVHANILARPLLAINRQQLELESCSNPYGFSKSSG